MKTTHLLAITLLSTLAVPAQAKTPLTPLTTSIVGNPINRQDNYTINTNAEGSANIECVFTNTSNKPADLKIWRDPKATTPSDTLHLKAGSKTSPFQLNKRMHLELKKSWWCDIYTPHHEEERWAYCAYLSISDAIIAEYKPFGTWNKTIHSNDTSYHCRLKKPDGKTSFFYFK